MKVTKTHNGNSPAMKSLPPLYALRAFEAAARLGSFSRASIILNITPGAVSRHVRTLESWFGCSLFVRNGPRVIPTAAAHRLAQELHGGFKLIEQACRAFNGKSASLRLKAPSTLTLRWLLDALNTFNQSEDVPAVELTSVWMDIDAVDFSSEPFDCAVLLGKGEFGHGTQCKPLFKELLIPVCAPELRVMARNTLSDCELIHPSPDRRDWMRWLNKTGRTGEADIQQGKVFDTLDQACLAAINGHGVTVADLLLNNKAIAGGQLALPFNEAVTTGDSYHLVWPQSTPYEDFIDSLYQHLLASAPGNVPSGIQLL